MKKEWHLEAQARFMLKEKGWIVQLDERETEYKQCKEMLEKLQRSNEEMK